MSKDKQTIKALVETLSKLSAARKQSSDNVTSAKTFLAENSKNEIAVSNDQGYSSLQTNQGGDNSKHLSCVSEQQGVSLSSTDGKGAEPLDARTVGLTKPNIHNEQYSQEDDNNEQSKEQSIQEHVLSTQPRTVPEVGGTNISSENNELARDPEEFNHYSIPANSLSAAPEILKVEKETIPCESTGKTAEVYPGDLNNDSRPSENSQYKTLEFADCSQLVSFFDKDLRDGTVLPDGSRASLHPWQVEVAEDLAFAKPNQQHPHKFCLCAANGSGKDKYVIAPFCIWFALTKVRSRTIITSSSGVQLSSQTESYIKDLAEKVNTYFNEEVFKIRQRYIYCNWSGSEIRLFATDEKGKAEGYHPWDLTSEMAIIVNEGKTVTDEIHNALRRCTGYNYWLEVSTPGEPLGFFYNAFTSWKFTRHVTSYDCPHLSKDELEADKIELGEESAHFRSKHLALFTSLGGETIIPAELINKIVKSPPSNVYKLKRGKSIGIDIAAGGDENAICIVEGNKCLKEYSFREADTTITTQRIIHILEENNIPKDYAHIYCDHGGISKGVADQLREKKWNINGIHNQWPALGDKKQYGNRGAENWYRVKRLFEELVFDASTLGVTTRKQLASRHYKQGLVGSRILLERKKDAKAHGRLSPDRADAFILSLTGLTIEDFLKAEKSPNTIVLKVENSFTPSPRQVFATNKEELEERYDEVTYGTRKIYDGQPKHKRVFNSLRRIMQFN